MAETVNPAHIEAMMADEIAANIQRLREAKGWSRPKLAKKVRPETSPQQIERLEKSARKLTIEWIEKLATALEVEPGELIGGSQGPINLTLDESVATEVARTFGRVALGAEPEDGLVTDLAAMLTELCETFARHPATRSDPQQVRPVVDLLTRRLATQS